MEFTGKTVEEATETGLKELNIAREDAEIKVIEEPTKGLFGRLKGKAVVDIVKKEAGKKKVKPATKEDDGDFIKGVAKAEGFLNDVLGILNINAKTSTDLSGENPVINIVSEKSSDVIGFRGEILDSLQTLASAVANIGIKNYKKVVVDCENYRGKREETLISLAHKLEAKATEMKREVILEPMNPYERMIIHKALSESTTVKTRSEGDEPNRHLIIVPNDKDEFSRPYNAGRNNENGGRKNNGKGRNNRRDFKGGNKNGFSEQKRVKPSGFGTYLGNSFKDNK